MYSQSVCYSCTIHPASHLEALDLDLSIARLHHTCGGGVGRNCRPCSIAEAMLLRLLALSVGARTVATIASPASPVASDEPAAMARLREAGVANNSSTDGRASRSEFISIEFEGITRDAVLYVPPAPSPGAFLPLVFNYHGYGSDGLQQVFYSLNNPLADAEGFAVLCACVWSMEPHFHTRFHSRVNFHRCFTCRPRRHPISYVVQRWLVLLTSQQPQRAH